MPFSSQAQRRYMYARHPVIAKRWRKESGPQHNLRERAPKPKHDRRAHMIDRFIAKRK